jgi:hypothetical protein
MGISIQVLVDPACITQAAWQRVYDETVAVLRGWPDPPIRPCYREIAGIEVIAYTRDVVHDTGWHICGDAISRRIAESIELPRELGVVLASPPSSEIVLRALDYDGRNLRTLLNNKTHGRPFHTLVVAIAMLIEHRLPHAAFVGGDLTIRDARYAQAHLRAILGEVVPLPLCVDARRLRARLQPHLRGRALRKAVRRASVDTGGPAEWLAADLLGILGGGPKRSRDEEIEAAVACTDVSTLGAPTRQAFVAFVAHAKALAERAELPAKLAQANAQRLLQTIASRTRATHLVLTEMAWAEIQRAGASELQLLATLAMGRTVGLVGHDIRRAIFESAAVRRFCLQAWANAPSALVAPYDPGKNEKDPASIACPSPTSTSLPHRSTHNTSRPVAR